MNNIKDERILLEKLKIDSNTYKLVLSFLIVAVLIEQFFLGFSPKEYAVELIAILLALAYQGYGHIKKGIDISKKGNLKEILTSSVLSSLGGVAFLSFIGGMTKPVEIIKNFVIIFALNFVIQFAIGFFTKKKQIEIDKLIDKD